MCVFLLTDIFFYFCTLLDHPLTSEIKKRIICIFTTEKKKLHNLDKLKLWILYVYIYCSCSRGKMAF